MDIIVTKIGRFHRFKSARKDSIAKKEMNCVVLKMVIKLADSYLINL